MSNSPFSLAGKTILVTGASSGIGRSIAIESAKMGAQIILTARRENCLKETLSLLNTEKSHKIIVADLLLKEQLENLVDSIKTPIDGIVHSAGAILPKPIQFLEESELRNLMDLNFFAPITLTQKLLKKKCLNKNSSIVFISSINGVSVSAFGSAAYAASKGAINGIAKTMALEFAPKNIRVNSITPGSIETEIFSSGEIANEQLENDKKRYPLKRYGKPEEVAYAAIYLLSDASSWTTGSNLLIDGGLTLL